MMFMDLAIVSSSGGQPRLIERDVPVPVRDYLRGSYRWHPTEDRLLFLAHGGVSSTRVGASGEVEIVSVTRPQERELPQWIEWTADGRAVLVGLRTHRPAGDDWQVESLALVNVGNGLRRTWSLDPEWDFRAVIKSVHGTLWQPNGEHIVLAVAEHSGSGQTAILERDFQSGVTTVRGKRAGRMSHLVASTSSCCVGVFEAVNEPPRLVSWDPRRDSMQTLTPATAPQKPRSWSVTRFETRVPAADGTLRSITTAVVRPTQTANSPRPPAVVTIYPGINAATAAIRFGAGTTGSIPNEILLGEGYSVVLPDLSLRRETSESDPSQQLLDRLLPQVHRAIALDLVDPSRLALMGHSYGAYGVATVVTRTNLFRAGIASSGLFDLPSMYGYLGGGLASGYQRWAEDGQGRMGLPLWSNTQRYIDNSPYYRANLIRTPLLLIHGGADAAAEESRKMFSALRRLDRTVQLAEYAGEGHVPMRWTPSNAVDATERILDFLRVYLTQRNN